MSCKISRTTGDGDTERSCWGPGCERRDAEHEEKGCWLRAGKHMAVGGISSVLCTRLLRSHPTCGCCGLSRSALQNDDAALISAWQPSRAQHSSPAAQSSQQPQRAATSLSRAQLEARCLSTDGQQRKTCLRSSRAAKQGKELLRRVEDVEKGGTGFVRECQRGEDPRIVLQGAGPAGSSAARSSHLPAHRSSCERQQRSEELGFDEAELHGINSRRLMSHKAIPDQFG